MPRYVFGVYQPDGGEAPPALQLLTTGVPNATQGVEYSLQFQATGGTLPYTWSLVAPNNSLPSGLNFSAGGLLDGTPLSAGTTTLNFRVTDASLDFVQTGVVNFQVASAGTFAVSTSTLPPQTRGITYSATLQSVNGTGAVTWSLVAPNNTLPTGLSLNTSTGAITGIPTVAGSTSVVVRATDSLANTADSGLLTITINQVPSVNIVTTSLNDAEVDSEYTRTLQATGGWGDYTWSMVSGSLPSGLSLNTSTGQITGTPLATSVTSFTVGVEDEEDRTDTQLLELTVVAEGTVEGPDDYYDEWSVHADNWGKYKLKGRTDEQLQALQQTVSQPLNGIWGYNPGSDTHPEAQDAMKYTCDRFNGAGARVWSIPGPNQLYLNLDSRIEAPDTVLYTWDWYWCQEFATNCGGVYAYKTWQTRNTKSAGWWTHLDRIYADTDTVHYFDAMRVGRSASMAPDGMTHVGDDRVAPLGPGVTVSQINYRNAKQIPLSKWCRYWVEIKLGQPSANFTEWQALTGSLPGVNPADMTGTNRWNMLSMWVATEDEEVERIMYRVPMSWGQSRAKNVESATINSFVTTGDGDDNWPTSYVGGTITLLIDGVVVVRTIESVSGRELVVTEDFPRVPDVGTLWTYGGDNYIPAMTLFSYEMNTSKVGPVGPMYGYGRDFMAFKNYELTGVPEEDPIFRKPVR